MTLTTDMAPRPRTHGLWVLVALLVGGCAGRTYRQQGFDTVTNGCRTQPALCAELAVPRTAQVATAMAGAKLALDAEQQQAVESALKECAEFARSEVLMRFHGGQSPTPAQCREKVRNARGATVSRDIWLGDEMHAVALACAQEKLAPLIPGRFSIEPTYRRNPGTSDYTPLGEEEVELLKQPPFLYELKGSLVPDVVIHSGNPLRVHRIYDFKFFCALSDVMPDWRGVVENGAPTKQTQQTVYMDAFNLPKDRVLRVMPRWGIQ
jgi:hypothetical protein